MKSFVKTFPLIKAVIVCCSFLVLGSSISSAQNGKIINFLIGKEVKPQKKSNLVASSTPSTTVQTQRRRGRLGSSQSMRRGLFGRSTRNHPASGNVETPQVESSYVVSPPNRYAYINQQELGNLNASNSWVEVDLSEQRAKVYKGSTLIIETQISTGKPGKETRPGYFTISEMLVDKRSTRYGTWYDAGGKVLKGDDHYDPPEGAVKFVGSEMPYWLRVNGGIGMHIGFVPDEPASHGCIRVPSTIQPLIYSKVKVGTTVLIKP